MTSVYCRWNPTSNTVRLVCLPTVRSVTLLSTCRSYVTLNLASDRCLSARLFVRTSNYARLFPSFPISNGIDRELDYPVSRSVFEAINFLTFVPAKWSCLNGNRISRDVRTNLVSIPSRRYYVWKRPRLFVAVRSNPVCWEFSSRIISRNCPPIVSTQNQKKKQEKKRKKRYWIIFIYYFKTRRKSKHNSVT